MESEMMQRYKLSLCSRVIYQIVPHFRHLSQTLNPLKYPQAICLPKIYFETFSFFRFWDNPSWFWRWRKRILFSFIICATEPGYWWEINYWAGLYSSPHLEYYCDKYSTKQGSEKGKWHHNPYLIFITVKRHLDQEAKCRKCQTSLFM